VNEDTKKKAIQAIQEKLKFPHVALTVVTWYKHSIKI
jgi:hypothetical protein